MTADKNEIALVGPLKPVLAKGFAGFTVHGVVGRTNLDALSHVRAMR